MTALMSDYLSCAETAKLGRAALKKALGIGRNIKRVRPERL